MNDELRAAQGAAASGSTTEDAQVECLKKIKNLEVAMSLSNHSTYQEFCKSIFILTKCVGTKHHIYYRAT